MERFRDFFIFKPSKYTIDNLDLRSYEHFLSLFSMKVLFKLLFNRFDKTNVQITGILVYTINSELLYWKSVQLRSKSAVLRSTVWTLSDEAEPVLLIEICNRYHTSSFQ